MKAETRLWGKVVGENIRRLRIQNNETQSELGEVIGYGTTAVTNYEKGDRLPDLVTAYKITRHYHASMDELMEEYHEL